MSHKYQLNDLRLKNLVATSGDIQSFKGLGIRVSSLIQWIKDGPKDFVTLP